MLTDITARKSTAEAMHLCDKALAATSEATLITDSSKPDNPIIYCNDGFTKLFGEHFPRPSRTHLRVSVSVWRPTALVTSSSPSVSPMKWTLREAVCVSVWRSMRALLHLASEASPVLLSDLPSQALRGILQLLCPAMCPSEQAAASW